MHKIGQMKKPNSLKLPTPTVKSMNNTDNDAQFELELCWCIQQLETALNSGKLSEKVADDTVRNLKVLKGYSAPLIRKRQVMKSAMGDYRAKMKEEEKKMALASNKIKFTPTAKTIQKSSFVKKSAILTSGRDFKFNFDAGNSKGNQTKEQTEKITESLNANNLQLNTGIGFKFNFSINEENNEIKFDKLLIK